jgi:2-polyprenyl-3-methyl-5-hydroxy-6-metoxy-1,4-benzoquinol methylase
VAVDGRGEHDVQEATDALDDRGYLEHVTSLSFEDVTDWTPERITAVRDLLSGWNHNIRLADGIYTSYVDEFYPAHREVMEVINHGLGGRFSGKRIVDIGCLEGYFSVECALQGAEVLGIEGKRLNIKKCEFVKSVLGVEQLRLAQDDAMRVTRDRYGRFDVVLALGLIYHLDDPFTFLDNVARLCDGFVVIDTLVALEDQPDSICDGWRPELSDLRRFDYRGREYHGRTYREYAGDAPQLEKDLSVTSSLDNEHSVWLTEQSLIGLLRDVGFEQVQKVVYGPHENGNWWADVHKDGRLLLVAFKQRPHFRSKVFDS